MPTVGRLMVAVAIAGDVDGPNGALFAEVTKIAVPRITGTLRMVAKVACGHNPKGTNGRER